MTPPRFSNYRRRMRDQAEIDRELALLAVVRFAVRQLGGQPTTRAVDQLLDERLATKESPRPKAGGFAIRPPVDPGSV